MSRKNILFLVFVGLIGLLTGCGKPWMVVSQAVPSPFSPAIPFAVTPVDFSGLQVGGKSEASYLSEKDEDQRASFAADKVAMNEEFTRALLDEARARGIQVVLATSANSAPFIIRPHIGWLEPGYYIGIASAPSEVSLNLVITTPNGLRIDEIEARHQTSSGMFNPASGTRLRSDASALGAIVAQYIDERSRGVQ